MILGDQSPADGHESRRQTPFPAPTGRCDRPLSRIINVNEMVLQVEGNRQAFAQCRGTITLCSVVTGGEIVQAAFTCNVRGLLRNLATEIDIDPG